MDDWKSIVLKFDLDLDSSWVYINLDTDLGYNTVTNSYEIASWMPMRSTYRPTSTYTHEWCQDRACSGVLESYDPGDLYWNGDGSRTFFLFC